MTKMPGRTAVSCVTSPWGFLDGRAVILVWTPRGEVRRIIRMSKANERELARYAPILG